MTCMQVAVGDSKDVLQGWRCSAFWFDVERELLASAHHAVAEQVAVVLSRTVRVADRRAVARQPQRARPANRAT